MLEILTFSTFCKTAHYEKCAPVLVVLCSFASFSHFCPRAPDICWYLCDALTPLTFKSFSTWMKQKSFLVSKISKEVLYLLSLRPFHSNFRLDLLCPEICPVLLKPHPRTAVRNITQANLNCQHSSVYQLSRIGDENQRPNFPSTFMEKENLALIRAVIWFHLLE